MCTVLFLRSKLVPTSRRRAGTNFLRVPQQSTCVTTYTQRKLTGLSGAKYSATTDAIGKMLQHHATVRQFSSTPNEYVSKMPNA